MPREAAIQREHELRIKHIDAMIEESSANTAKLNANTAKLQKETKWYEFVIMGGALITCVAIAKFFVN